MLWDLKKELWDSSKYYFKWLKKKMFLIQPSNSADETGMVYYQKWRWEMLSTVLWLTRTNIRWYASLLLVKKTPSVLVLPQTYTNSGAPTASAPIFSWVTICTLKITLSIIVMVLKYQKQAAKKVTGSNYTNKLIYVNILVYTSKIDPSLGFLIYNPGEENLVD